jgi:hypothetical protein
LVSRFGKFQFRDKRERRVRNPATDDDMILPLRRVVTYKCSGKLRDKVNGVNGKEVKNESARVKRRFDPYSYSKRGLMRVKPKPAMKSISSNIFTSSNPCAHWRKSKPTSWRWKPVL